MKIHILNLAPVRVGNLRAEANVQIGTNAPYHSFAIWRTPNGDIVQAAPKAFYDMQGVLRIGPPAFALDTKIMERVSDVLLGAFWTEWDDDEPFVPTGETASHADNNVGWSSGKPKAGTAAAKPKGDTAQGADEAAAQTKSAKPAAQLSANAESEPATRKQVEYLSALGYKGPMPGNKAAASQMIERLKNEKAEREAEARRVQPAMGI